MTAKGETFNPPPCGRFTISDYAFERGQVLKEVPVLDMMLAEKHGLDYCRAHPIGTTLTEVPSGEPVLYRLYRGLSCNIAQIKMERQGALTDAQVRDEILSAMIAEIKTRRKFKLAHAEKILRKILFYRIADLKRAVQ